MWDYFWNELTADEFTAVGIIAAFITVGLQEWWGRVERERIDKKAAEWQAEYARRHSRSSSAL